MPAKVTPLGLPTWTVINNTLRTCDEKTAATMLKQARAAKLSEYFLFRIYSRFSRLRRNREMAELFK